MKFTSVMAIITAVFCLAPSAMAGARLGPGSTGGYVTQLQQNLHANLHADYYPGAIDASFGPMTQAGLMRWQKSSGFPVTGKITIGSRQWNTLRVQATVIRLAGYISQAAITGARQTGWAIDASKSPSIVTVLRYTDGIVRAVASTAASYGDARGPQYVTRLGVYKIYAQMGYYFYSKEYDNAPMHWAACFNGGQCLHYDPLTISHGCIHIPSMPLARFIGHLPIGTTVAVHE